MISTRGATLAICDLIREALDAAGIRALVTHDAEEVESALLDLDIPAILVSAPYVSFTHPAYECRFETAILGNTPGDTDSAWVAVDQVVNAIDAYISIENAEPITWEGTQSFSAPGYKITHHDAFMKED